MKIAKAVVLGSSHKNAKPPIPCQDAAKTGRLLNGFDVIIVSDGAGSSRHSDKASKCCVDTLFSVLEAENFDDYSATPACRQDAQERWKIHSTSLFKITREKLIDFAAIENIQLQDLQCTLILVVRTNWGFLSANIGDGRSGYYDGSSWPLSVPFMTFTAGATYFLIKGGWEHAIRSEVTIPKQFDRVEYFFASTDGPQSYLIDSSAEPIRNGVYDDVLGPEAFYDSNKLYHPFFEGLIRSLHEVETESERDDRLINLIKDGTYILDNKSSILQSLISPVLDDDKTLVLYFR